jgi:hypothetical protein
MRMALRLFQLAPLLATQLYLYGLSFLHRPLLRMSFHPILATYIEPADRYCVGLDWQSRATRAHLPIAMAYANCEKFKGTSAIGWDAEQCETLAAAPAPPL